MLRTMARRSIRRRPAQPPRSQASWLAACWGWLADLFGRKPRNVVKDAAATGLVGELFDRTVDHVDGC
jgi:hypothetical protein